MSVLSYFDVLVLVVAAPIMILIGVPAVGYAVGAGAWIVLRAVGVAMERYAAGITEFNRTIGIRLAYMLGRIFLLAIAVILVRKTTGRTPGSPAWR